MVSTSSPLIGGHKTPTGTKKKVKPNEFGLKLQSSLKEHVSRMEQEKAAKTKVDFAKPAKQPDRRLSTDTKGGSSSSSGSSKQDKEALPADKSSRDKDRKVDSSRDKKKDRDKDRPKDKDSHRERSKDAGSHQNRERDKLRPESSGDGKSRHPSGSDGKSRRSSVEEVKPGELDRKKAHESFMQEAKQRLHDRREKEEKVEREKRRLKEEAKRRERKLQQQQELEEKDRLKEKISSLDINEIKKLLTETVAAKEGVTLNTKDSQLLLKVVDLNRVAVALGKRVPVANRVIDALFSQ